MFQTRALLCFVVVLFKCLKLYLFGKFYSDLGECSALVIIIDTFPNILLICSIEHVWL